MFKAVIIFIIVIAVLFGGMFLYLRSTTATTRLGRYGMPVFGRDDARRPGARVLRPAPAE